MYDERHTEQQQHEEEERSSCGITKVREGVRHHVTVEVLLTITDPFSETTSLLRCDACWSGINLKGVYPITIPLVGSTEAVNQCLNDILDDELSRSMPALLLS